MSEQRSDLSRRAVLAGMGAAGGAVLLGSPLRAAAAPLPGAGVLAVGASGVPSGLTTVASAREANVSYQFRSFFDFITSDTWANGRTWGGSGVYTPTSAGYLTASFDAPPGTVVSDIEWYVLNSVVATWGLAAWGAGHGQAFPVATGSIASGSGIRATKIDIPAAKGGPYPHGTRLIAYLNTPTGGTVQLNGARLGFTHGTLNPVLFTNPLRVYDSREHTALAGGTTRTITMPTLVPAGAQAVMLTLSIFDTHGVGGLRAGAGGIAPTASAIRWARTGDQLTNSLDCNISPARQVAIASAAGGGTTHFTLDLLGYLV